MPAKVNMLAPYLVVKGAEAAIDFYVKAFGAVEKFRLVDPLDGRIGHAELAFGRSTIMLADEYPDFGAVGPDAIGGSPVKLHLDVDDAETAMDRALQHGATVLRPLRREFYGSLTGMVADPFGYSWFIASSAEEVSPEEMQRRWSEMNGGAAGAEAAADDGPGAGIGEIERLAAVEKAFNEAVVSNDVAAIAACMTEDWVLVTPEVGPVGRSDFLGAVERGVLSHDSMTKDVQRVKIYGDVAVVTGRGQNTGTFRGAPISADEWITDVYNRIDGRWLCVLTHLTPARA